jgi:hypothetical protein
MQDLAYMVLITDGAKSSFQQMHKCKNKQRKSGNCLEGLNLNTNKRNKFLLLWNYKKIYLKV